MVRVSNPIILIGLGAWVLAIFIFAAQPLPNVSSTASLTTKIFLPNGKLEKLASCSMVYPLQRNLEGGNPHLETLRLLFQGPTENELGQGYFTNIPRNTQIKSLVVENGVARVDLSSQMRNTKDQCRLDGALAQITETLKEFGKIKSVEITVEGLPASFIRALR